VNEVAYLQQAWGMFQTDDRRETVAAALIVVIVVGPIVYQIWKARRAGGSR
jgi:hypothetical protein